MEHKKGSNLNCLNCNQLFYLPKSEVQKGRGKYCSRKCRSEHQTRLCRCQTCNNEFPIAFSAKKRGRGIFCSRNCAHTSRSVNGRIEKQCLNCGLNISVIQSNANKGFGKFCSRECVNKFRSVHHRQNFESQIYKTDCCWLWTGRTTKRGYGIFQYQIDGRRINAQAHRMTYELYVGAIPAGKEVCHDCPNGDNPGCVNPSHLWLGSHRQNMEDMKRKHRSAFGEKSNSSKLTAAMAEQIKQRHLIGEGLKTLAGEFGVSVSCISLLVQGKTWKHLLSHSAPSPGQREICCDLLLR